MLAEKIYSLEESLQSLMRHVLAGLGRGPGADKNFPRLLCYHGVEPVSDNRWVVDTQSFDSQMAYIREYCSPVGLQDVLDWVLLGKQLPDRAVAVTFDDGYRNVYKYAFPIMQRYGIKGTVFVCPDLVASETDSDDDKSRFMRWREIHALAEAGWIVGSHSMSHAKLSQIEEERLRYEIVESKRLIESQLETKCVFFCYPYGTPAAVSDEVIACVRESGYSAAFLATTGPVCKTENRFKICRSKVLAKDSMKVFVATIQGRMDLWSYIEKMH